MMLFRHKVTIIDMRKPSSDNINLKLQWLGSSLGLFGMRDKDKSCFRIFIELLKATKKHHPYSSDKLAENLKLTRGTVVHHLNKLMEAGIVVNENNRYLLRVDNLHELIAEVEKDLKRACQNLKDVAREIDEKLGL